MSSPPSSATTSVVWKYAVRLDDAFKSVGSLATMLDFWNQGPGEFVQEYSQQQRNSKTSTNNNNTVPPGSYRSPIASNYVIFACADGQRYLVSHSVARMCDSLAELLDDLDLQNGDVDFEEQSKKMNSSNPTEMVETLVEDCALLEVAIVSSALEAVIVYLSLAIENGATSTIPYPLTGVVNSNTHEKDASGNNTTSSKDANGKNMAGGNNASSSAASGSAPKAGGLEQIVQPWEMKFLEEYTPHVPSFANTSATSKNQPSSSAAAFSPVNPIELQQQITSGAAKGNNSANHNSNVFCPPLIAVLRAADYLGINSLRDLACAHLALKMLSTRDEGVLAATLGLTKLPSEGELEDVYSRFPFLAPSKYVANKSSSGNQNSGVGSSVTHPDR